MHLTWKRQSRRDKSEKLQNNARNESIEKQKLRNKIISFFVLFCFWLGESEENRLRQRNESHLGSIMDEIHKPSHVNGNKSDVYINLFFEVRHSLTNKICNVFVPTIFLLAWYIVFIKNVFMCMYNNSSYICASKSSLNGEWKSINQFVI